MSYYLDDECNKCIYYVRFLTSSDSWTCELCHLVELGSVALSNDIMWGRYQLNCGHQVHIRCFRKWCKEVEYVGCPFCGPIEEVETNEFCIRCEVFGHATRSHKK
jgi:hypothetical protein